MILKLNRMSTVQERDANDDEERTNAGNKISMNNEQRTMILTVSNN
jgi:hypothetical protein